MRYSKFFGKTKTTAPHDADSVNARLLTQGGFVDQMAAGIYNFLPLGKRVLDKIIQIIREEMNEVGGQEMSMPALHPIELWKKTGRDKTADAILYRTKGAGDKDFVFAPSHEEAVTPLAKQFIQSYKDLPMAVYQFQTKFRNEPRAKSGVLRGREFGMKDMYSFHATEEDMDKYYDRVKDAYMKVYERCGLKAFAVEALGGIFSDKFSHEFSVETPAGEDTILVCENGHTPKNVELGEAKVCTGCKTELKKIKAVEVGNIFKLGTKYSKDFDVSFNDADGKKQLAIMGCYGIGTTRLVGTIVEACHDDKGIIWPKSVAPYLVHLISLGAEKDADVKKAAEDIYEVLQHEGVEVLYDDRDESAGKKFNDADLIGIPLRIVVSGRTLQEKKVEWKFRNEADAKMVDYKSAPKEIIEWAWGDCGEGCDC